MPAQKAPVAVPDGVVEALQLRRSLILTRVACANGATRAQVVRDFSQFISHKLSPAEWRRLALEDIEALLADGLISERRGRLTARDEGEALVDAFLCRKGARGGTWPETRDGRLVAKGLDLEPISQKKLKALLTTEGLRAFILQKTYGLPHSGGQTPPKLRAQLAIVALERAFGKKIKSGLGAGPGFSANAGRLLAGQLSSRPRDLGSDGRLVAALAAEAVDARQTEAEALKAAILRRLMERALKEEKRSGRLVANPVAKPVAANDAGLPGASMPPTRRPDPARFARVVIAIAQSCAEGWAGNRKAPIARVWKQIELAHPEWALTEIEFKSMLAEAHKTGHLLLATADLKDKSSAAEIEASAITYKNTQWHLIRIVDAD